MPELVPVVLAGADERDLTRIKEYRAVGGYAELQRARSMEPQQIIDELNASNLRGPGGAFFATGRKAGFIPRDSDKPIYLVDVREPAEWEIVKIPGATLIPKNDILSGAALSQLPQDKKTVLYCKTGIRSAEALAALKAAGFKDAVHVQGGVVAWVKQVDPSLPIY